MAGIPAFSLCVGGRLHAKLVQAGMAGATRGHLALIGALLAIGWLPLVILSAVNGTLLGGVDHPLLTDLGAWARFCIVIPIMVVAEPMADRVLGIVVHLFRRTGLVREADAPVFEAAVVRTQRMATSDRAELVLLVTALGLPHLLVASLPHLSTGTAWFGTVVAGQADISAAGRWYTWVSMPLVQFLMLRWLWRIFAWWVLLWRISKLDLDWAAAHPDGAGGLGFLAWSPRAFRTVFIGVSTLAAAAVSNQIQFGGHALVDSRSPILAFLVCQCLLLLAPQFFFARSLIQARYAALIGYGLTGAAMTRAFERQWTDPASAHAATLLDSPQSSAMIDYAGTYDLAKSLRPAVLSLREIASIVVPLALPFAPLLLYEYSLKDILQQVLQLVR